MSTAPDHDLDDLLTIDELAGAVGLTVRTTRYYASLGFIAAPVRRGRVAYYGPVHRARLELVRALTDHGFTLQAVERVLSGIPDSAGVEELALQRAMLTSWSTESPEVLDLPALEKRAGRALAPDDLELLQILGGVEAVDDGWRARSHLPVCVELLDLDVPRASLELAEQAIRTHMASLADELTTILHTQVLKPYRRQATTPEDALRLERTVSQLRRLTLEAVVSGFQMAANAVIERSLGEPEG